MRPKDIKAGVTYRFGGYNKRELKPRTVTQYEPDYPMPGGRVWAHTGRTRHGYNSQTEIMAGSYFAEHVLGIADIAGEQAGAKSEEPK